MPRHTAKPQATVCHRVGFSSTVLIARASIYSLKLWWLRDRHRHTMWAP